MEKPSLNFTDILNIGRWKLEAARDKAFKEMVGKLKNPNTPALLMAKAEAKRERIRQRNIKIEAAGGYKSSYKGTHDNA